MANLVVTPSLADLDSLAALFDAYRVFYEQPSDKGVATAFVKQRLENGDSRFFAVKEDDGSLSGFVQLYPTFSSVSAGTAWVLNDLYVMPEQRRRGIAEDLMTAALAFAKETGAVFVALETHHDNASAQNAYRKMGFVEQTGTRLFEFDLS